VSVFRRPVDLLIIQESEKIADSIRLLKNGCAGLS